MNSPACNQKPVLTEKFWSCNDFASPMAKPSDFSNTLHHLKILDL
ncbi:hypothetical protein VARIO8X_120042 [Burkholderiales bacterium 8X]|nr:hypothetical protein VARIO8X_120042 [Burkholderiales bacterium 8X]